MSDISGRFIWEDDDIDVTKNRILPRDRESKQEFVDRCRLATKWGPLTDSERRKLCSAIYDAAIE